MFSVVIVIALLALAVVPVYAQGPIGDEDLTSEEMSNAIVVANPDRVAASDILSGQSISSKRRVYRLAGCDPGSVDPDAPCYFTVVTGYDSIALRSGQSGAGVLAYGATVICGKNIYNMFGGLIARLQQNVDVTYHNQWGKAPVTMNWGNLDGTETYLFGYWWEGLSGPNPNPGWGIRTNTAYSTASGNLRSPVTSQYFSTTMTINYSGTFCS